MGYAHCTKSGAVAAGHVGSDRSQTVTGGAETVGAAREKKANVREKENRRERKRKRGRKNEKPYLPANGLVNN